MKLARLTNKQKEKAWADPRALLPPMHDPDFRWVTMDCQVLTTREMSTWHIFNSLKMIWNNTVPEEFRVGNFKPYNIRSWSRRTRRHAIECLYHELFIRSDITPQMIVVLRQMHDYMTNLPRRLSNAS